MTTDAQVRAALIAGAREFNAGRYFEAHEILEEALDVVPNDLWDLFIGLIQTAVGYHKVSQQLLQGGRRMLERALGRLAPFPADAAGLNVEALRQRIREDLDQLRTGPFDVAAWVRRPPRLQPLA